MAFPDLSAAFDTVDHNMLLSRLKSMFGVSGVALSWFASYLNNRTQSVKIANVMSKKQVLKGSVHNCTVITQHPLGLSSEIL